MKRQIRLFLLLGAFMMTGATTVMADDYAYLTFEQTDGAKTSFEVSSLGSITIGDKSLTVGATTFTLTNLRKMYFSKTADGASAISNLSKEGAQTGDVMVFDISGKRIGSFSSLSIVKESLPAGNYILKANGKSLKVAVK